MGVECAGLKKLKPREINGGQEQNKKHGARYRFGQKFCCCFLGKNFFKKYVSVSLFGFLLL